MAFIIPAKVKELLTVNDIENLLAFPLPLKLITPKYLAAAEDISPTQHQLCGGKRHATISHWSKACKMLLLIQPSLAAA